jgi:hypothetical protein
MGEFIVVQPDASIVVEKRIQKPNLEELQQAVGGLITPVDCFLQEENALTEAYANDEGILMGMEANVMGTMICKWPELLFGPIVILKGFPEEEEESDDE